MGLLKTLLEAVGRIRARKYAPQFESPTLKGPGLERIERERAGQLPRSALPAVVPGSGRIDQEPEGAEWPKLPPEDAEFLLELGLTPDEIVGPYAVPDTAYPPRETPAEAVRFIRSGQWVSVVSSNVDAWRFNEKAAGGTIDVRFTWGGVYRYGGCDLPLAEQFYMAPSAGRFVWYIFRMNPTRYPLLSRPSRNRRQDLLKKWMQKRADWSAKHPGLDLKHGTRLRRLNVGKRRK